MWRMMSGFLRMGNMMIRVDEKKGASKYFITDTDWKYHVQKELTQKLWGRT